MDGILDLILGIVFGFYFRSVTYEITRPRRTRPNHDIADPCERAE